MSSTQADLMAVGPISYACKMNPMAMFTWGYQGSLNASHLNGTHPVFFFGGGCYIKLFRCLPGTLPETKSKFALENRWLEYQAILFGGLEPLFRVKCYSFREWVYIRGMHGYARIYGKKLRDFPEQYCMKFGLVSYTDPCTCTIRIIRSKKSPKIHHEQVSLTRTMLWI